MNLEPLTDDYLVKLASSDEEAIRHFIQYFGSLLLIKLRARMLPPLVIDEIRQETFARVFAALRKPEGIRDGRKLGSFVNSVCNHVLAEYYRRDSRWSAVDDVNLDQLAAPENTEKALLVRERQQIVHSILQSLPTRERAILEAVFLEEADKDAICHQFGIDRGYLRVLVHRAKAAFRQKLSTSTSRKTQAGEPAP
ncbi:MAG: sigma-70 family RNA polymerase sigma factor [Bryobacteraceae bacterium]|nr:sigma-70 family RNA polymerase sigma factor [Bryobacteraceae bacterium]MDW8379238.1 sigma-70 family RNA polymerase sigma factor [Bryobacterales bacterium]